MSGAVHPFFLPIEQIEGNGRKPRIPPSLWLAAEDLDPLPPIHVAPLQNAQYRILSGAAVWYAAQLAYLSRVPVVVTEDDSAREEPSLMGDPIREARALAILKESHGLSDREMAQRLHWTRKQVADARRLLTLHSDVQALVAKGSLRPSLALELVGIPENRQQVLSAQAARGCWTLRDLRSAARRWRKEKLQGRKSLQADNPSANHSRLALGVDFQVSHPDPVVRSLEQQVTGITGAPCRIVDQGEVKFLALRYHSLDELDGLLQRLGWEPE